MRKHLAARLLATALALPALAHDGGHHVAGVVKEVTTTRLVVTDGRGKDAAFALGPGTQFRRGQRATSREQVVVGERVVVHGRDASGQLEATVVQVGSGPRPEP